MSQYLSVLDSSGNRIPSSALDGSAYEAAATGRRMSTWGLSSVGPNTALSGPLSSIRSRTRTVVRNNPVAAGAIDSFVSNLVGTDISPHWDLDDAALKEDLHLLWSDSQQELDAAGVYDFYGQQEQVARGMMDGGEVLARFIPRYTSDGLLVPLQVQLLEGDHLDAAYNSRAPNGNEIRMGIEWDKRGRRAAYWLFLEHPGEHYMGLGYAGERVRVPASEILHVFRPLRIGQARGCPWLATLIVKLRELDQYEDAELVRKKTAALFTAFLEKPVGDGQVNGIPGQHNVVGVPEADDINGNQVEGFEPGAIITLPNGRKIVFSNPADVGGNYKDFIKQQFRVVARGLGITYEQLSGDLEGVTFSSIRAGLIEFRRLCEMLQHRTLIFQFCRPVVRRWLDTAVLSGAIKIPDYLKNKRRYWRVTWQPDGWDYVDPVKDRIAEQMDVRNGFDDRDSIIGRRGNDAARVDAKQAAANKRADDLKLVHDSDPRQTAKNGMIQKAEENSLKDED